MMFTEVTSVSSQQREFAEGRKGVHPGEEQKEQRILVICSKFPGRKTTLRGDYPCYLLPVGTMSRKNKLLYTLYRNRLNCTIYFNAVHKLCEYTIAMCNSGQEQIVF